MFAIGKRWRAAAALSGIIVAGYALAQTPALFLTTLTGNEQINVIQPATGTVVTNPQILTVTANMLRNTTGYALVGTGTTVTSTPSASVNELIATGAITTWNVTLPNPAADGQLFEVVNGTGSAFTTNVTVTAGTTPQNQTLANTFTSQTLAANGGSAEFSFVLPTLTWYRVR